MEVLSNSIIRHRGRGIAMLVGGLLLCAGVIAAQIPVDAAAPELLVIPSGKLTASNGKLSLTFNLATAPRGLGDVPTAQTFAEGSNQLGTKEVLESVSRQIRDAIAAHIASGGFEIEIPEFEARVQVGDGAGHRIRVWMPVTDGPMLLPITLPAQAPREAVACETFVRAQGQSLSVRSGRVAANFKVTWDAADVRLLPDPSKPERLEFLFDGVQSRAKIQGGLKCIVRAKRALTGIRLNVVASDKPGNLAEPFPITLVASTGSSTVPGVDERVPTRTFDEGLSEYDANEGTITLRSELPVSIGSPDTTVKLKGKPYELDGAWQKSTNTLQGSLSGWDALRLNGELAKAGTVATQVTSGDADVFKGDVTVLPAIRKMVKFDMNFADTDAANSAGDPGISAQLRLFIPELSVADASINERSSTFADQFTGVDAKFVQHNPQLSIARAYHSWQFTKTPVGRDTSGSSWGSRLEFEGRFGNADHYNLLGGLAWQWWQQGSDFDAVPLLEVGALVGKEVRDSTGPNTEETFNRFAARLERTLSLGETLGFLDPRFLMSFRAVAFHDSRSTGLDAFATLELIRQLEPGKTEIVFSTTRGTQEATLESVGRVVEFGLRSHF